MASAFSTLHWPHRPQWASRVDSIDPSTLPRVQALRTVLGAARDHGLIVLNGSMSGRVDLAAAVAFGLRRRPPRVLMTDCTWSAGGSRPDRLARRAAVRAMDGDHVTYCVLSTSEVETFPRLWGIDPERVVFTPWYVGLSDEELAAPTAEEGYVFAGGDSHRDYTTLLEAAGSIPAPVRIASRSLDPAAATAPNVDIGPVSHDEFTELTRRASVVVVPLQVREDRSSGQFTYLGAMALGKILVVTDAPGVRDHVDDGRTGLVVANGDAAGLAERVSWALDPANREAVRAMSEAARADALERFGAGRYVDRLAELVDRLTA